MYQISGNGIKGNIAPYWDGRRVIRLFEIALLGKPGKMMIQFRFIIGVQ